MPRYLKLSPWVFLLSLALAIGGLSALDIMGGGDEPFGLTSDNGIVHLIQNSNWFGTFHEAFASSTSQFSQTINAGTLATAIRSNSSTAVSSPTVTLSATTFSFSCLTGGSASTGTFGTASERIYVDNPNAANNGWSLTVAAQLGSATTWNNASSTKYDFNDGTSGGCNDGADTDSVSGQLTMDPSVGTITTDCSSCSTSGVTKGSSTAFLEGTTNSITLLTAAQSSDDVWRGYLTGVSISQTIPAEQAAGTYTLRFSLTVAAT